MWGWALPKRSSGLTALSAKAAGPGTYPDGGGLLMIVRPTKAAFWMFRFQLDGRRRDMGLGAARGPKAITLASARDKAEALRKLVADGIDPLVKREQDALAEKARLAFVPSAKAIHTFKAVAEDHIAVHSDGWRNPKHVAQWSSTLAAHAYPVIGDTPVDEIDVTAVLKVLRPIWTKTPETASRLRGRIEAILDAS
jgi:hypothetical protein